MIKQFPQLIDVYPGARFNLNLQNITETIEHILAQVDLNTFALISLTNGNRWNKPVKIDNKFGLTEAEIVLIFNCAEDYFWTKIEEN